MWKDTLYEPRRQLIGVYDGPWYGYMPTGNSPARGWEAGYLLGSANAKWVQPIDHYIDDVVFSTESLL